MPMTTFRPEPVDNGTKILLGWVGACALGGCQNFQWLRGYTPVTKKLWQFSNLYKKWSVHMTFLVLYPISLFRSKQYKMIHCLKVKLKKALSWDKHVSFLHASPKAGCWTRSRWEWRRWKRPNQPVNQIALKPGWSSSFTIGTHLSNEICSSDWLNELFHFQTERTME